MPKGSTPSSSTSTRRTFRPTSGLITLDYPRGDLSLTTADGKQAITPDEPFRAELHNGRTELAFKARALVQTGAEASLAVTLRCGDITRQCQVRFTLPPPDVVVLRALRLTARLDGPTEPRPECESVLRFDQLTPQRLEPFPNRLTTYTFEMFNRSGLGEKLLVKTYILPDGFWDNKLNCPQACDLLARAGTLLGESAVELPQSDTPQKLAFPVIKPPAKASEKLPEKPPEKPAGSEPAKPKVDISAGLAMVVCDAKSKEPKWLQLYTFAPLRPASYLAEPRAKYDPVEGKLEIDVGLAAGRDLPPCSPKAPVRLAMAMRNANGRTVDAAVPGSAGLPGQTKALLDPGRPRDVLYAFVPSAGRDTLQIEINVDDYPRAFLYDLSRSDVTWRRNLWRVRITDPPREPVSAIRPREALPVKFGVDSPADSFLSRGGRGPADDAVRLEIFNEQRAGDQPCAGNSTAIARSRSNWSRPTSTRSAGTPAR